MESKRTAARVLVGVAASLVAAGAALGGTLTPLKNASVDARFGLRHTAPVTDIVIVAIDEDSVQTVGDGRGWPFRRLYHARAVDRLRAAGVQQIIYDVQFTEPSARGSDDFALYDALGRAGGATLATTISEADGSTNVLGGDEGLAQINSRAAAADLPNDHGAVVRRYPQRAARLPSIAVVAAARISGRRLPASAFDDGTAWIDFRGGLDAFPTVSFADLVAGRVPSERLRGKIVLVGSTAPTLQDSHATATSGPSKMPGVEVQAHALWTALHGNPLRDAPLWLTILSIALLGLAVPLISLRLGPRLTLGFACGLAALAALAAQVAFAHGIVVAVVGPLLALGLGTLGTFIIGYALEGRQRRRAAAYSEALGLEVAARTSELRTTQLEVLQRLSLAAEQRDNETGLHLKRMSLLCGRLARATGLPEPAAEEIEQASLLHDVGKIGIPDEILHKPGMLTDDEWAVMQRHTTIGAELLAGSSSQLLCTAESIARTHHERWDGTGYPAGMAGEEIPLAGRIAAICDVYDALLTARPYKAAWTVEAALTHIDGERGRHFDPSLADCFAVLIRTETELSARLLDGDLSARVELVAAP